MTARTGIIGLAQTSYLPEHGSRHITELAYEAVSKALEDAGMEIGDIDNVVSCSTDFLDGRTISNRTIPEAAVSLINATDNPLVHFRPVFAENRTGHILDIAGFVRVA